MKKILSILFALAVMALSYQLIVNLFISHKETTYSILNDNDSYLVKEKFYKDNGKHYYEYVVMDKKNNEFSFYKINDFNKQVKVLKDIVSYKSDDLLCYLPVYKDGTTSELNCFVGKGKKKEYVDYNYLVMSGIDTSHVEKYYDHLNYSRNSWKKSKDTKSKYSINNNSTAYVFKDNVPSNYIFPIWNYNGLFYITSGKCKTMQYLDKDIYENNYSVMLGKYYFIFDYSNGNSSINDLYYINVEDYGKTTVALPNELSRDMVVNGVYKNKLYITDLKNKRQFSVDPLLSKSDIVGNEDDGFINVQNNKIVDVDSREFIKNKITFNNIDSDEITEKYGEVTIMKSGKILYFMTKDGDFYRAVSGSIKNANKLFHFDKVSDWISKDNAILLVSEDTMYFYDEDNGLKPILQNKELSYNSKNICNFYKKS